MDSHHSKTLIYALLTDLTDIYNEGCLIPTTAWWFKKLLSFACPDGKLWI